MDFMVFSIPFDSNIYIHTHKKKKSLRGLRWIFSACIAFWGQIHWFYSHMDFWSLSWSWFPLTISNGYLGIILTAMCILVDESHSPGIRSLQGRKSEFLDLQRRGSVSSVQSFPLDGASEAFPRRPGRKHGNTLSFLDYKRGTYLKEWWIPLLGDTSQQELLHFWWKMGVFSLLRRVAMYIKQLSMFILHF